MDDQVAMQLIMPRFMILVEQLLGEATIYPRHEIAWERITLELSVHVCDAEVQAVEFHGQSETCVSLRFEPSRACPLVSSRYVFEARWVVPTASEYLSL